VLGGVLVAIPVKLEAVLEALQMTTDTNSHHLDKRTGEIVMLTDEEWDAAEADAFISQYPDWQRDLILKAREIQQSDHFVALPDKLEINNYEIMERFCQAYPNQRISAALSGCIRGKGAFRRFGSAVADFGIQDEWYRFELNALKEIAVEWLEEHAIPFTGGDIIEDLSEDAM
jgi:hypothetical protein